jgi:hypothetical protein
MPRRAEVGGRGPRGPGERLRRKHRWWERSTLPGSYVVPPPPAEGESLGGRKDKNLLETWDASCHCQVHR